MKDALSFLTDKDRRTAEEPLTSPALRVSLCLLAEIRALRADLAEARTLKPVTELTPEAAAQLEEGFKDAARAGRQKRGGAR